MRIIVTGTGDAFSAERFGSSALIETPEGFVAIDCPASPLAMYRLAARRAEMPIDPGRIRHYLLTHLHADHAGGLETIAFYRRYKAPDTPRPGLWAAAPVLERTWDRLAPSMDGRGEGNTPTASLEDFFQPGTLAQDAVTQVGSLEVRVRWATHSIPTVGMLISECVDG